MVKKLFLFGLIILVGLLAIATPVFAVSVTNALYMADIVVINTGGTTTEVAAVCDINTDALIDGKFVTEDLLNTAIQTSGGTDIAYMPGVDNNPWVLFIPSIGTETKSYSFYAGGPAMQTGFYYFPGSGGMSTDDAASLEFGNTFQIEQQGWVDTSAGDDKNLVYKPNAFRTYASAAEEITSVIYGYEAAYPTVAAVAGGNDVVDQINHTVNLPAGIVAGNLLVVFFATDGNPGVTFPAGWTELSYWANGANVGHGCWYRIADGTEGASITVTTSAAQMTAHTSYRITDYSGVPEIVTGLGSSANPNPLNLVPSWGGQATLWLAACGYDLGTVTVSAYPASYASGRNDRSNNTGGVGIGTARRNLTAASEDPGAFTLSASDEWVANTVAIAPAVTAEVVVVTATGITNGVRTVRTTADGTNLLIQVYDEDDVLIDSDTVALGGASVIPNDNDWSFLTNGSMPYMEYQKIWVDDTLVQHIVYERDTTFQDQTAYNNDATPTFFTGNSPVVQGRSNGATTAVDTLSHSITLPSGITAGELLLVIFSVDGDPICTDASGHWTKLGQESYVDDVTEAIFYKVATGSNTLTITSSEAEQSSYVALRISGAAPTATASTNSSTNSNPPNHNPGTTAYYLWIATRSGDSTVVATAAPTNYSNLQSQAAAGVDGASTNTAEYSSFASSENPDVFTSAAEEWVSYTISVTSPISATFQNFSPIEEARCTGMGEDEATEMLTTVPDEPEEMYGAEDGGYENIPWAELLDPVLEEAGIPADFFWIVAIYGLAAVMVILGYQFIRSSLLFPAIAGFCFILFFSLVTKGDPIPLWTIFPYILNSAGFLVMEKTFGW